jgi:hypothetical protein
MTVVAAVGSRTAGMRRVGANGAVETAAEAAVAADGAEMMVRTAGTMTVAGRYGVVTMARVGATTGAGRADPGAAVGGGRWIRE